MTHAQLPGNHLVRMRGEGTAPGTGRCRGELQSRPTSGGCGVQVVFAVPPSNLSPGASVRVSLSRPGPAGSDIEDLAQPPSPPPPPLRAQTAPGPVKEGAVPNRRPGSVRGVPMSSPPGRRARLSYPGTSCLSSEAREELRSRLLGLIESNRVMIFSKSYCPHSTRVGGAGAG